MLMPETVHEPVHTEQPCLQLRILAGAHEGACVALSLEDAQSVHLSNHGDADIWITDAPLFESGNAWLYADAKRWVLLPEPVPATDVQSLVGDHWQEKGSTPLGEVVWLGDVCLVVCDAQAPWQDPSIGARPKGLAADVAVFHEDADTLPLSPAEHAADMPPLHDGDSLIVLPDANASQGRAGERGDAPVHKVQAEAVHQSADGATGNSIKKWAGVAAGLILVSAAAGTVWWMQSSTAPVASIAAAAPVSEALQKQQVQEARLVIAMVDPGLRLEINPLAQGGVRISGWLADQSKLDQVVQALATLRPLPQVALRTMAELNDVVQEVGRSHGVHLTLRPQSQSRVQVTGVLWEEPKREEIIHAVQQRLPAGLQLVDGLYAPSAHVPVVTQWLAGLGLDVRDVAWKDTSMQLNVRLRNGQRRSLEQALLRRGHPLEGIPFRLVTAETAQAGASVGVVPGRLSANAPGVPVAVRTVVGGVHPYLITSDGQKLQLGAQVGAWRLVSIASDHVLWDGPRRLEVAR